MAPVRVAICGTGLSFQAFHQPLIASLPDQFVLHSVLERSGKGKAKELCGHDVKTVTTIDDIVNDKDVDLVVISTPNNTHYPFAKAALENGKHVMCEKPVTPTVKEAEELAALAKSKNLVFCVYQNRRWDSDFVTLKKVLKDGKLGPINVFTSRYDRYRPLAEGQEAPEGWKFTPGQHNESIYNLGSHIIDQVVELFGIPDKLTCRNYDQRGVGMDEAFEMTLIYPPQPGTKCPLAVYIGAQMLDSSPENLRFSVKGTNGSWLKYGLDCQEAFLRNKKPPSSPGFGDEPESQWGTLSVAGSDGKFTSEKTPAEKGWYPAIYENIYEAISTQDPSKLVVQPEQVIWNMRIIELGNQSSKEERTITVPK